MLRINRNVRVTEIQADAHSKRRHAEIIRESSCPVVLRGYARRWTCVERWSKEYLREKSKTFREKKRAYRVSEVPQGGVLMLTNGKQKFSRESLGSFLQGNSPAYLLGIHDPPIGAMCPIQKFGNERKLPVLAEDIPMVPFEQWFGKRFDHHEFFMAREYATTNLHYDGYKNIYIAAHGQRVWTITHPDHTSFLRNRSGGVNQNWSMSCPNKGQMEGSLSKLIRFERIVLNPGDLLYIPDKWWHQVESVPDKHSRLSIAFSWFWEVSDRVENQKDAIYERHIPRSRVEYGPDFNSWLDDLDVPSEYKEAVADRRVSALDMGLALFLISKNGSERSVYYRELLLESWEVIKQQDQRRADYALPEPKRKRRRVKENSDSTEANPPARKGRPPKKNVIGSKITRIRTQENKENVGSNTTTSKIKQRRTKRSIVSDTALGRHAMKQKVTLKRKMVKKK